MPQAAMTGQRSWTKLRGRCGDAAMIDFGSLPFPENAPCSAIMAGPKRSIQAAVKRDGLDPATVWKEAENKISFVRYAEPGATRSSDWAEAGCSSAWGPRCCPRASSKLPASRIAGAGTRSRLRDRAIRPGMACARYAARCPRRGCTRCRPGTRCCRSARWNRRASYLKRIRRADKTETGLSWDWDGADDSMFWKNCRSAYARHRSKGAPQMLDDRCLYNGDLDAQLKYGGPAVVYNKSGSNVSAAPPGRLPVTNVTLYWAQCRTFDEAKYLSAVLNADAMRGAITATKKGSLDIASEPFKEIPMRRFDPENRAHARLAALAGECEPVVRKAAGRAAGLNARRKAAREALRKSGRMGQIDELCAEILPDHAAPPGAA